MTEEPMVFLMKATSDKFYAIPLDEKLGKTRSLELAIEKAKVLATRTPNREVIVVQAYALVTAGWPD